MKVYCLLTYEYSTYSYSGIAGGESFIHATLEGAQAHAAELGLKVVECCDKPEKEAEIDEVTLLP
jgi:hypothetical protein